jgi:aminopeptidase N
MVRRAFEYRSSKAYYLNTYEKPALAMQTLEKLLGAATMDRILRTWARRYRFAHPTTADFIATVNEVTGADWRWFFEETFYSNGLCDYAASVKQEESRLPRGFLDDAGSFASVRATPPPGRVPTWDVDVTIERRGEVRLPVEIRMEFADGRRLAERWDGRETWKRYSFRGGAKLRRALVDPERKLALDVDYANNEWRDQDGQARRAAAKWSARYLFWLQTLLELHTVLG